jgi:hypothetical protein
LKENIFFSNSFTKASKVQVKAKNNMFNILLKN